MKKPEKMVAIDSDAIEECYAVADYASPGAAAVLRREGQIDAADAVLGAYYGQGGTGAAMDPMDLLIMMEEMGGDE